MSLSFGDNINYQGKSPNFSRDQFITLKDMKDYPATSMDEGHESFCLETGKKYRFSSDNPFDENTGYWREILGNEVSNTEPLNKSNIWYDKGSNDLPYSKLNTDVSYILEAISKLQEIVARHEYAFTHEMNPGGFDNSARLDMMNSAEPEDPSGEETTPQPEPEPEEEMPDQYTEPNIKHICIKAGKYLDMVNNKKNFVDNELLWCTDRKELYIMSNGSLINIGKTGGGEIPSGDYITPDDLKNLESIGFVSPNGQKYLVKINNDGSLNIYNDKLDIPQEKPSGGQDDGSGWIYTTSLFLQKLYINSVYCGGLTSDEHSYNGCSHNFVELSNLTNQDINLNGLSLQYGTEGSEWKVLPLWGVIKAQSTFLIRGAQCSVMDANTTKIKVKTFDIEWYDGDNLIKFDSNKSKFFLTWGTDKAITNPYSNVGSNIKVSLGYIDLIGLNKAGAQSADVVDSSEKSPYAQLETGKLFCKYYNMDPVSQATKDLSKRDNSADWYYVDLTKDDVIPSVSDYTPKASFENKNIFFNKSKLDKSKPNCLNITLGKKATSPNASRCFNWISVDYYDEFLWYKKKDSDEWTKVESFKNESGNRKYYNRIRSEATDGTPFTVHKVIVKDLDEGSYEYKVGRLGSDGQPDNSYISDVREFKVISDTTAETFTFVQTSDQQGFNWDEYQVWKKSADYISKNTTPGFIINTGDITQNGNRFNEWLDYYQGRESLKNVEEMTTIGNNDLCPADLFKLGDGGDSSKISSMNMTFFYTYEMDEENPPIFNIEGKECYIPSLYSFDYGNTHFICVNTEIPELTETAVYGLSTGQQIYPKMKEWCETDISKASEKKWKIAYCHEMPFTIITQNVINNYYWNKTEYPAAERSGSRINTNVPQNMKYWFSQFCQDNNIRLVLGGHKHTYSCSWPIKENVVEGNVKSMRPIIQVTEEDLTGVFESDAELTEVSEPVELKGCKYPSKWVGDDNYDTMMHLCTFEKVSSITAPVYAMCQATGYKHTSNKELPAPKIPWLKNYFPATVTSSSQTDVTAKVNAGQRYPFYIVWEISPTQITGTSKKLNNIFNSSGKFNINTPQSGSIEAIGGNGETNSGNDKIVIK